MRSPPATKCTWLRSRFRPRREQMGIVPHRLLGVRSRLAFADSAEWLLRRLSPDVVHDMGCGWSFDVLQPHDGSRHAQFEQKLLGLPRWVAAAKRAVAGLLPRYRQFAELERRQLANPTGLVIALSKMVARDLVLYGHWPEERIRLIYNGVDLQKFSPQHRAMHRGPTRGGLGVRADETLVLFVGHDFQRKGLPTLLPAISRLVKQGLPLRLAVLGGKKFGAYRRMARRLGIGGAVSLSDRCKTPCPTTPPPTCTPCPRCTIRVAWACSKRWPAGCPSSLAATTAPASWSRKESRGISCRSGRQPTACRAIGVVVQRGFAPADGAGGTGAGDAALAGAELPADSRAVRGSDRGQAAASGVT